MRAFFLVFLLVAAGCGKDNKGGGTVEPTPSFDRSALLTNWADNIIIPAFDNYVAELTDLKTKKDAFINSPTSATYTALTDSWQGAYSAWQAVAIFDIGKAEEIQLRNFTNIFPTSADEINANINSGSYNLELPSNFDAQGFPALDYLLFGTGDDAAAIIATLGEANTSAYLSDLVDRLFTLGSTVAADWNGTYRDAFVDNDGSSATSSVDKLVNDFLFYYERFLRAGKVGIPAGVFSGSPISSAVEAPYSGSYSKNFFMDAMEATEGFFFGNAYSTGASGIGLDDNINALQTDDVLAPAISDQWDDAKNKILLLSDNFKDQVESDNSKMLEAYDELQKAVVLLKVDMLSILNIQVDFVDADGD